MLRYIFYFLALVCSVSSNSYENIILKPGNHMFLTDEINQDTRELFIFNNRVLNTRDIYIYINSNGGSVMEGNKIIENINFLSNTGYNVSCIAQNAFSMAFHILQHCPRRYVTKTSTLMQHQIKLGVNDNLENIKSYLNMIEALNDKFNEYSALRINMSKYEFMSKIENDWWIYGSDNILKYKLADQIVSVGCAAELFEMSYIKEKKSLSPIDLILNTDNNQIKLNGCPIIH